MLPTLRLSKILQITTLLHSLFVVFRDNLTNSAETLHRVDCIWLTICYRCVIDDNVNRKVASYKLFQRTETIRKIAPGIVHDLLFFFF